jgi:hypothetical protein
VGVVEDEKNRVEVAGMDPYIRWRGAQSHRLQTCCSILPIDTMVDLQASGKCGCRCVIPGLAATFCLNAFSSRKVLEVKKEGSIWAVPPDK